MSTVITDNLTGKASAGNVTITSEGGAVTMQLQQGLVKWWINQDQQTVTGQNTRDSFNIASYVDGGTGKTQLNFSNNMNNANYCVAMGQGDGGGFNDYRSLNHENGSSMTTSRFDFYSININSGALDDYQWAWLQSTGDLA